MLKNPAKVNAAAKVLSLVVGDKDFTLAGHEEPGRHPDAHGITHTLQITGGGHTWINWRRYLRDYLQVLFK